MSLTNTTRRLTTAERAREPRSLGVIAYYDGFSRGCNPAARPAVYPRRLTLDEVRSWRDGFAEGQSARRRHDAHGFASCESVGCYEVTHL